jgi:cell division protein FtsB
VSPNWYVDYPKLEEENKELKAEVALLKETLEFIDDHNRALSAMEIIKGQKARIAELEAEIKRLNEDRKIGWQIIVDMTAAIRDLQHPYAEGAYDTLLKRAEDAKPDVLKEYAEKR